MTLAQQLMIIVPADSKVEVGVVVDNKDVGFVHNGDAAEVKIDALNFTTSTDFTT